MTGYSLMTHAILKINILNSNYDINYIDKQVKFAMQNAPDK